MFIYGGGREQLLLQVFLGVRRVESCRVAARAPFLVFLVGPFGSACCLGLLFLPVAGRAMELDDRAQRLGRKEPYEALAVAQEAFASGRSVVVRGLEALPSGRVARIGASLSSSFGLPVQASAQLEAPGAAALGWTCCPWPRFLLQTSGHRTCQLASARNWGLLPDAAGSKTTPSPFVVSLQTGDVLFVPSFVPLHMDGVLGSEPVMHMSFDIRQDSFTWSSLISLVCRRLLVKRQGQMPPPRGSENWRFAAASGADGLDHALLEEAVRLPALGGCRSRSAPLPGDGFVSDAFAGFFTAVLQHSTWVGVEDVPIDLPAGWLEAVQGQLAQLLQKLRRQGHLEKTADLCLAGSSSSASSGSEQALMAEAVSVRGLVELAAAAEEGQLREASMWGLSRQASFSSLARARQSLAEGLIGCTLQRADGLRPLLSPLADGAAVLHLGSPGARRAYGVVPREVVQPAVRSNRSMSGGQASRSLDAFSDVPEDFELPVGSLEKGKKYFKKYCAQCHSIYPDNRITRAGQTQLGPTMFNVYGRASGLEEIQNKQANDRCEGILWLDGPLMNYMKNPRVMAQGRIQMNFRGIQDFQTRVDIVHYLRSLDWSNQEVMNPPEKPSSFAPARWLQAVKEGK
ncbi:unnamed protein product [Polarella glacialis]|uniref:Cytochrome c domain-containing protein n=1 Tax=Polarella glacialis TaxID=89957 RepID=A0A813GS53_POLGL|nr:unnamed protein product [Polarella glacialis]